MAMFKKGQLVEVSSRNGDWGWEGVGMIIEKPTYGFNYPGSTELTLTTSDGIQEITWQYSDGNEWGWYVEVIS